MKPILVLGLLAGCPALFAQPKGPPPPPLLACGQQGNVDIVCGTRSPEDLELAPDGKSVLVSQMVRTGAGISLFDPAKKSFSDLPVTVEPLKDWGDPACPGPIGSALAPHGTSIGKNAQGKSQLLVVNHGGRESIEMFEVRQAGGSWSLVWHGCVTSTQAFNDVAAMPDGGFVATHPTALQTPGTPLAAGQPSGYVSRWIPGKGEMELPGTRFSYPNGVVVSRDGKTAYYAAWTGKEIHKYDLTANKEVGMLKLDFQPDNITWTKKNQLLAAGVKGTRGDCPEGSGSPCMQGFNVAEIDPAKMTAKTSFDSAGKGALIGGVSVALEVGSDVYVGSFQGDRLVKYKK